MNRKKKIITYPHPILIAQSQPVEEINQEILDILDEMTLIMKTNNGIGLAAPQIGISKRLITVFLNEKNYQVINPKISWQIGSQNGTEGCLSLPNQMYEVNRSNEVVIEGITPEEKEISLLRNGLLARVFQHEIDHLDGILINTRGTFVASKENNIGNL